jgi:hypothetical protein
MISCETCFFLLATADSSTKRMSDTRIPNTTTDLKKMLRRQLRHNKTRSLSNLMFDPRTIQKQFSFSLSPDILQMPTESGCSTLGCVKLFPPFFFGATDPINPKKNSRDLEVSH